MGDYSRDTFKLTNVMHQMLTGETVTDPQHYVGVRLQQGVPLLDADWNELDDIRRTEAQALLNFFIGSGVPANNTGFEITGSGASNSFTIGTGIMSVEGMIVVNPQITTYATQPESATLPALNQPPSGVERTDLVYLDVWDEEIGANGSNYDDLRLVNGLIGVETSRRLSRHWAVRVEEGADDLSAVTMETGHHYTILALMERSPSTSAIQDNMIIDQRKIGITLADNLKVPLYVRRGVEIITPQRFATMLDGLRSTLFSRLKDNTIPYQIAAPEEQRKEALIFMQLQELMHLCQLGESQALTGGLDNDDAVEFLSGLYDSQGDWLGILDELGNDGSIAQTFIDEYTEYLNGTTTIDGIKPALDDSNLLRAVVAQEALNTWLASAGDNLPEGSVDALYITALPYENLTAGSSYEFTYTISANFTTPETDEEFQIQVDLNSGFGTVSVDQSTLTFTPPESETTITVTVTPSGGLTTAELDVIAYATRSPVAIRSSQTPITLTLNALPPVASFYFYAGALSTVDRVFEIPQGHLTRSQGRNVLFRLRNESETESRTYEIMGQIIPDVTDTTGWSPLTLTATDDSPITVPAGGETDVFVNVRADDASNIPPVGTTGQIISTAELIAIDGSGVSEPQEPVTVTISFEVTS